jgi:hypothetical protein
MRGNRCPFWVHSVFTFKSWLGQDIKKWHPFPLSKSNGRPQTATLAEYQSSIVIKIRYKFDLFYFIYCFADRQSNEITDWAEYISNT